MHEEERIGTTVPPSEERQESLKSILMNAFQDHDYRCILIGFSTCGFNMSIIESHLFSQYQSYGIPGRIASLTLTVYGITTMLSAMASPWWATRSGPLPARPWAGSS